MTKLKVAVRVRPMSSREIQSGSIPVIAVENENTIAITNLKVPEQNAGDSRERVRRFTFDYCFQKSCTQENVFEAVEDVIGKSMRQRYHSCVLAYGQSSSGKTHTMMGFPDDPGLTPKLCKEVFGYLSDAAIGQELLDMKVTVSYLEIYNEKVRDLLAPDEHDDDYSRKVLPLKIREHPKKGPYVQGLSQHLVSNTSDLLYCLEKGNRKRKVASTFTNPLSSRSHSVFSVNCDGVKLNLIDLAGSERAGSRFFNISRFKEGANINKSLVALGNVIYALAEQSSKQTKGIRRKFIPFRDSVLTWLLKDTLGGNSNTVMVATVSPSSACYSETVNTLRFGQRAKLIVSRPVVNEDPKERTIRELRAEIYRLKELLENLQISPKYFLQNSMNELAHVYQPNNCTDISNEGSSETSDENPKAHEDSLNNETSISCDNNAIFPEIQTEATNVTTEELLPLINVKSLVRLNSVTKLRRTYSVDHTLSKMEKEKLKMFSSDEYIPCTSTTASEKGKSPESDKIARPNSSQALLRRKSLNKSIPSLTKTIPKRGSLGSNPKKTEKAMSTVESKVDSNRKGTVKPRAQIVAAVTNRLYSKLKKKEASTDTSDINTYELDVPPKELTICSNARARLQELTKRALRAHRNKNEETQTDFITILRMKEISTDVNDLQVSLAEVKDAETMSEMVETSHASVDCTFLEDETRSSSFSFTRSCGTQSEEELYETEESKTTTRPPLHPISFTKYLRDIQNDMPPNPIYTNSVNINISNNYMNGNRVINNESEDSLENQNSQNICLPTPDLISNHNSLEQHPESSREVQKILHENIEELHDQFFMNETFVVTDKFDILTTASCITIPKLSEQVQSENLLKTYAPEVCILKMYDEAFCIPLPKFKPKIAMPKVIETNDFKCEECIILREPLVLKSIVKDGSKPHRTYSEDEIKFQADIPDSLEYHLANKKVKFLDNPCSQEQRLFQSMTSFLEEATQLISNMKNCKTPLLENKYEIEVSIDDIQGLRRATRRTRKKPEHTKCVIGTSQTADIEKRDTANQTPSTSKADFSVQCPSDYTIPVNKYEALLEDSCKRLEEKISKSKMESTIQRIPNDLTEDVLDKYPHNVGFDHLDFHNADVDDSSSVEGDPSPFSDYGSLPRSRYKRYRAPSCSPSAFLKQLTQMRKQIIKNSREDLVNVVENP